jgi:hypothetical protein
MYGLRGGVGLYLPGQGHTHTGPGTSLVQMIDWTQAQEAQVNAALRGLGLAPCGMGCACGGKCGMDQGLGLFESGFDFSQWGATEWAVVAVSGYVILSTVFTTQRGAARVRKSFKKYARRRAAE